MYSYSRAVQYLFGEDSWLLEQDNRRGNQLAEASFYLAKRSCQKVSAYLLQAGGRNRSSAYILVRWGIKRTKESYRIVLSGTESPLSMSELANSTPVRQRAPE